jgi:hypothetical protein
LPLGLSNKGIVDMPQIWGADISRLES